MVSLKLQSEDEITEEVWQDVVANCNYDFQSNSIGVSIEKTEIKEVSETPDF